MYLILVTFADLRRQHTAWQMPGYSDHLDAPLSEVTFPDSFTLIKLEDPFFFPTSTETCVYLCAYCIHVCMHMVKFLNLWFHVIVRKLFPMLRLKRNVLMPCFLVFLLCYCYYCYYFYCVDN